MGLFFENVFILTLNIFLKPFLKKCLFQYQRALIKLTFNYNLKTYIPFVVADLFTALVRVIYPFDSWFVVESSKLQT